jgi:ATP-dependent protease HslVU (ClpYQ) ATPase subunit
MESKRTEILDIIYDQLLECFMGKDYHDKDILEKKMNYLKNGDMDDRFVTIEIPEELELEGQQFISIEEFISYLKTIKLTGLKEDKAVDKHIISVREAKEFLLDRYYEKVISDVDYKKGAIRKVE